MSNWIVSPSGTEAGTGTVDSPWSLTAAFQKKAAIIQPGDQVLLRGGVYLSPGPYMWWPDLRGTVDKKIVFRPFAAEKPAIDMRSFFDALLLDNPTRPGNVMKHDVHGVQFWKLEFFSSNIARSTSSPGNGGMPNCIMVEGEDIEFIHCYIHDIGNWLSSQTAKNMRSYGNICVNFGWLAPDRGHGHCMYIENDGANGSIKEYENNFAYGSYDIAVQLFGTAAKTQNIRFTKNAVGGGGEKVGVASIQFMMGQNRPSGIQVNENTFYTTPATGAGYVQDGWPWDSENHDTTFNDNLTIGPETQVGNWDTAEIKRNSFHARALPGATAKPSELVLYTYTPAVGQTVKNWKIDENEYGDGIMGVGTRSSAADSHMGLLYTPAAWQAACGGDAKGKFNVPPALRVRVFPSTQIPGIVHIHIWNPAKLATVPIDLSTVTDLKTGDAYELRDVLNFNGPAILSGSWSGAVLQAPTNLTRGQLAGAGTPPHTAPEFLMFVLTAGKALDGTWVPKNGVPSPVGPPEPPPPPVPVLAIGAAVKIDPTLLTGLGVRALPDTSTPHFAVEMLPTTGIITAGPTHDLNAASTLGDMWTVKFADATGWVVGRYIVPTTIAPPPPPPPPTGITIGISPATATGVPGQVIPLTAITNDAKGVTWQGGANGAINPTTGGFDFKATLPGTYTVNDTSVTDTTKVGTSTITISLGPPPPPPPPPPPTGGAGTYSVTGTLTLK